MPPLPKIKDVIPLTNGLFSHIDYEFWDFTSGELDLMLLSRCGQRLPAPVLDIIQGQPDDPFAPRPQMTTSQLAQLGSLILHTYQYKWDKLINLHATEYDILKNYLDEYEEVMQDDDSATTSKTANKADRAYEVSQLASSTGSTNSQTTENQNETESTRRDNFSSDFSRTSTDNTTRTDNLSEAKNEVENVDSTRTDNLSESKSTTDDSTVTRTDNLSEGVTTSLDKTVIRTDDLTDTGTTSQSDSDSHTGGNYTETVTRALTATGGQDTSNGVYGFNSAAAVGDSESEVDSTNQENETTTTVLSGTKTDSHSKSGSEEVTHTGTQENVTDEEGSSTKLNTGTQQTVTDAEGTSSVRNTGTQETVTDKATGSTKVNTGTQSISESTSVTDSTLNVDNQVNSTESSGSSSSSNQSSQQAASTNDVQSGATSQLAEDSIVSRALSRARRYTHKGNIGNLTPQQLIRQEIDLWRWNFIETVLNDVKDFITIPIYS